MRSLNSRLLVLVEGVIKVGVVNEDAVLSISISPHSNPTHNHPSLGSLLLGSLLLGSLLLGSLLLGCLLGCSCNPGLGGHLSWQALQPSGLPGPLFVGWLSGSHDACGQSGSEWVRVGQQG